MSLQREIERLAVAAGGGDIQAGRELLAAACRAVECLQAIGTIADGRPGQAVFGELVASAHEWPILVPAIDELRAAALDKMPGNVGGSLPFRARKGRTKNRSILGGGVAFLAIQAFHEMEPIRQRMAATLTPAELVEYRKLVAATPDLASDWRALAQILPPLAIDQPTIKTWADAGTLWAEDQCQGQWKDFPWPAAIKDRAKQATNTRERGPETAVREYLAKGFRAIARHLPLIDPQKA